MAVTLWLRELFQREDLDLNKFVTPEYFDQPTKRQLATEDRERFKDLITEYRKLAEGVLPQNADDNDARYFVASAYGVLAAFAITADHSRKQALDYGKKSYELHNQLVSRDPHFYDSYMTLGIYEYIVDNLPWYSNGWRGSSVTEAARNEDSSICVLLRSAGYSWPTELG
jgi:hypothetical protein